MSYSSFQFCDWDAIQRRQLMSKIATERAVDSTRRAQVDALRQKHSYHRNHNNNNPSSLCFWRDWVFTDVGSEFEMTYAAQAPKKVMGANVESENGASVESSSSPPPPTADAIINLPLPDNIKAENEPPVQQTQKDTPALAMMRSTTLSKPKERSWLRGSPFFNVVVVVVDNMCRSFFILLFW
eukprot:PhM_4_TR16946/c0_g1_i1/m.18684